MGRKGRRGTCDLGEEREKSRRCHSSVRLGVKPSFCCHPPWRRPSCWSEAACRSEGCSSWRGGGTGTAAPGPTLVRQGSRWCGTWWDSWARTRSPLWRRGKVNPRISVRSGTPHKTWSLAYRARRWTFSPRRRSARTASSEAAGRLAGWSCRLWAC